MNIIIGAGVSGLSAARALAEHGEEFLLLEKSNHVGGLGTQYRDESYWFDYSGHYFHFKDKLETRDYLLDICPFKEFKRVSRTFLLGRFIPFPVQFHLSYLPSPLKHRVYREIMDGMDRRDCGNEKHLGEFLERHMGNTLVELFFKPFLTKYYREDLSAITARMDRGSIPVPDKDLVDAGYRGQRFTGAGYNPVFYYPETSLRDFIRRFAQPVMNRVRLNTEVVSIDEKKRTVTADGKTFRFHRLISTMPLKNLVRQLHTDNSANLPAPDRFRHISTMVVNVILKRKRRRFHWVYLAEKQFPFYRVGFYPVHTHPAVYLEKSVPPGTPIDRAALKREAAFTLKELGVIHDENEIVFVSPRLIPVSYVIFTRDWNELVPPLLERLSREQIYSIGRFGSWNYTSMSDDVETARGCISKIIRQPVP